MYGKSVTKKITCSGSENKPHPQPHPQLVPTFFFFFFTQEIRTKLITIWYDIKNMKTAYGDP
jgi:hypothetical protein